MIRTFILIAVFVGVVLLFSSCVTTGGGGRVESCGIDMKYCAPGP